MMMTTVIRQTSATLGRRLRQGCLRGGGCSTLPKASAEEANVSSGLPGRRQQRRWKSVTAEVRENGVAVLGFDDAKMNSFSFGAIEEFNAALDTVKDARSELRP